MSEIRHRRKCYVCGRTCQSFSRLEGVPQGIDTFLEQLNIVGSDVNNFGCMHCGCHDRERHLFMFFDKLSLWKYVTNANILHFAPEEHLGNRIESLYPAQYVKADICPRNTVTREIDATAIPFEDDTFDFLMANHVLEHIPDYSLAVSEFYRVLKPGAYAVLQTPYSKVLKENFEDAGINTNVLRQLFYGQEDHVRIFGQSRFLKSLEDAGFLLKVQRHKDLFDDDSAFFYGVPAKEDLILVQKRSS